MPTLTCPDCKSPVAWSAAGCAACGAGYQEIQCAACKYVGLPEQFARRRCPRCQKEALVIVPAGDDLIEEVGSEAFVDDVASDIPSIDEIDRGFAPDPDSSRPAKSKPEPPRTAKSDRLSKKATRSEPPPQEEESYGVAEEPKEPEPTRPAPLRRIKAERKKPAAEPAPAARADAAPDARPPVLKRKRWGTAAVEQDETPPPEPAEEKTETEPVTPRKSVSAEPVKARRSVLTVEFSPKTVQILRWSALGVPVLIVGFVLAIWFGGNRRPAPRPIVQDTLQTPGAEAGIFESRAKMLYDSAVEYYRSGQDEMVEPQLRQIVDQYGATSVAASAREALERIGRGEPPFGETIARNTPPPDPEPQAPVVVEKKKPSIGIPISKPTPKTDDPSDEILVASPEPGKMEPPRGSSLPRADVAPRSLPDGFVAVDSAGVHSSGWPIEIICLKDLSHMMLVPAGEFQMGSNAAEPNAQPARQVTVGTFYIDRFEITLAQYERFLDQRRAAQNAYRDLSAGALAVATTDKHPVVGLAWRDAKAYADWAEKSLPTEAQWEKAARGTDGRLQPWQPDAPVPNATRDPQQVQRIGSSAWDVSVYGCYDMGGNAWEWCADWYDPNAYRSNAEPDPRGPAESLPPSSGTDPERSLRGGSPKYEVVWRAPGGLNAELPYAGVRCVVEVEAAAPRKPEVAPVTAAPPAPRSQPVRVPPGGFRF